MAFGSGFVFKVLGKGVGWNEALEGAQRDEHAHVWCWRSLLVVRC